MEASCDRKSEHTPCPEGYIQWHAWAERMIKTHRQVRCTGCGRYAIWVPKRRAEAKPEAGGDAGEE